ncbi:hypothetical protein [Gardnerella swidsinskii]|uniref:hypothetical protein n=1 Tax=Gardnerella swidsinskii TaxID=2792979 RepID=UPI0039EFC6D4
MFNSHIFSRFLRLVRSIRRSLFAFFVAIAILLATFVIAPTYALSAGESATSTEKAEGAKAGSTKNDGESNKQSEQSESNNTTEPNKKNTDTSSTLNKDNKESQSVKRQKSDSNNGVDKAKLAETAVKKSVKKKDIDSAEAVKGTDRGANEKPELPEACKNNRRYNTPEKCYSITYGNKTINIKSKNGEPYNRVPQILTPTIKVAGKVQQTLPAGVWLGLEKYSGNNDSVKYAFFKGENDSYTAKSTKNSDGSIRFFASKWLVANTYRFYVVIHYPGGSKSSTRIKAILAKDDLPKAQPDDLSLSLYDFGSAQDGVAVSGNKIIIKPKSKGSTPSVGTVVSDDNKDVYDPINKLFIESKSTDKPGSIYHRMICHENGSDNYTSDRVNDLSLVTQTQFKHMENQNRPDKNAENSAVYENDDYTERSQSWISGTPKEAGTFECKVFAIKDVDLKQDLSTHKKPQSSKLAEEFGKRVKTNTDMKLLFDNPERNIVEDKWDNKTSIAKGVDWDYKTVIIQFGDKPKPKISDNDLTLKVYPFKTSDGSLPAALSSSNNNISAILGMSLKPFVDATSAADSTNKITLRVLCSKGKKKDSGSRSEQPSEPSQPSQTAGSPQAEEPLVYKTWSSNLAELGLSVPEDTKQTRCNKAGKGDNECTADKVASQASMEVTLKPTAVGNYQCVVYALKPKAFNAQSGKQTPTDIDKALAGDKSLKENKDFAAFTLNIDSVSNFTLPHTGGQSWNLQLGILAALLVNLLAAGFVVSQSERGRKLILGRRRGLCNHV